MSQEGRRRSLHRQYTVSVRFCELKAKKRYLVYFETRIPSMELLASQSEIIQRCLHLLDLRWRFGGFIHRIENRSRSKGDMGQDLVRHALANDSTRTQVGKCYAPESRI